MEIRAPETKSEWEAYYELRWEVLRKPLGMGRGSARDAEEAEAIHLAAFEGERLVGAGRLHFLDGETAQVRYMAVAPDRIGRGIGRRLLEGLQRQAAMGGCRRVVLNARDAAVRFYERAGFTAIEQLELHNLVHWRMEKRLEVPLAAEKSEGSVPVQESAGDLSVMDKEDDQAGGKDNPGEGRQ